ncbi:hypothetical protein QUA56_09630 [Microcoleus sp. N3A4]|uniref:hypothetical protein n=1 Tax=Microcoleus sp. N3A4 TaxID=3055379 RepID=UPI002FD6B254
MVQHLTSCTILDRPFMGGLEAHPTRKFSFCGTGKFMSCGTGILPVQENGTG